MLLSNESQIKGKHGKGGKNRVFRPYAELYAEGKKLRQKYPRKSHAEWKAPHNRPDPLHLLTESSKGRIPSLIPIRYGRMLQSSFAFYRGAALNMAADLAATPSTGLRVQACGDAHLCNFGIYATPERRVVFDINDLDETLPAPWEWDLKRPGCKFCACLPQQRVPPGRRPRRRAFMRPLVSREHGGIQPYAVAGRVVRQR